MCLDRLAGEGRLRRILFEEQVLGILFFDARTSNTESVSFSREKFNTAKISLPSLNIDQRFGTLVYLSNVVRNLFDHLTTCKRPPVVKNVLSDSQK